MQPSTIGFTIDVIGKLLIGYTSIRVHHRVWKDHKIDKKVFDEMHIEQKLGYFGLILIVIGYFLQLPTKLNL